MIHSISLLTYPMLQILASHRRGFIHIFDRWAINSSEAAENSLSAVKRFYSSYPRLRIIVQSKKTFSKDIFFIIIFLT